MNEEALKYLYITEILFELNLTQPNRFSSDKTAKINAVEYQQCIHGGNIFVLKE